MTQLACRANPALKGATPINNVKIIDSCRKFAGLLLEFKDKWVLPKGESPIFEQCWTDMVVRFFFYSINTFFSVRIAQCASAFNLSERADHRRDWCGIISHINRELGVEEMDSLIPGNYFRYNALVGAGTCHKYDTAAEIARLQADDPAERHTWGYLYAVNNGTKYDPSAILDLDDFFWERQLSTIVNDCVIHTINYVFRHPVFVHR
jgi:hypothetical protein